MGRGRDTSTCPGKAMGDKKALVFPTVLFGIFFLLVASTGFFQIRIIQNNIEDLLRTEGEFFFKHLAREIDKGLEYLYLLDRSPTVITPYFLNIMAYDEAIAEELYDLFDAMPEFKEEKVPIRNVLVTDRKGKVLFRKGSVPATADTIRAVLSGARQALVKMPTPDNPSLVMAVPNKENVVFLSVDGKELDALRTRTIVKDIMEREGRRFNLVGITIRDERGATYLAVDGQKGDTLLVTGPLGVKYLPYYSLEISISRALANDTFRRTTFSFLLILLLLVVLGAFSTYAIFLLERRHGKRLREMEEEFALKERLVSLGRLASGMAHEIRNPLNAISISVQRLKREFPPGDDKKAEYFQFVDIIRDELLRVDRIVEEFLLSTKAQAPFLIDSLYEILEEVTIILGEKAREKGVTIVNGVEREVRLPLQRERMKQAFYNIVLNGIEAAGEKGVVEISSKQGEAGVDVYVRDTGPGIKKEDLRAIFEYYYTTKDKGMGLGLPISYLIVKDHGGDIQVTSEEGAGTTFVIRLSMNRPVVSS
jgi:signal transduction histidine kinase